MSQWDKTKLYQRKNRCRWKINIWYVTQNYQSLEESKIKSQHTTAHLLESPSQVFVQEKWYIHPQKLKILTTPNANKDVEQLELCIASGGKTKWYSHIGKWFGGLFFKVQHALSIRPSHSLPSICAREMKIHTSTKTGIQMWILALFIIASN